MEKLIKAIDSEELISEVKQRRVLYSASGKTNANRQESWKEVLSALIPDFNEKSSEQKAELERLVQRRWKSLRDCFWRADRKREEGEEDEDEDEEEESRRIYKYYHHLSFLKTDMEGERPPKRVKKEATPAPENPDKLFLLSLVDELGKVPVDKKLETRIAISNLIAKAQVPDSGRRDNRPLSVTVNPVQLTLPVTIHFGSGNAITNNASTQSTLHRSPSPPLI